MRPKTRLGGESLSANRTVEGPIFGPFHLGVVVAEVLLQVGQLDEGSSAIRQVTLVRPLSYKKETVKRGNDFGDFLTFLGTFWGLKCHLRRKWTQMGPRWGKLKLKNLVRIEEKTIFWKFWRILKKNF
jgi:hypothetical protein